VNYRFGHHQIPSIEILHALLLMDFFLFGIRVCIEGAIAHPLKRDVN
jgi:hypothetical protein